MLQFDIERRPIQEKKPGKSSIDPQAVEDCRKVVKGLERGVELLFKLKDPKQLSLGRKALQEAGLQEKIWLKVRKERGSDSILVVQRITKQEFDETARKAKERGAKLKGKKRAKKKTGRKARKAAVPGGRKKAGRRVPVESLRHEGQAEEHPDRGVAGFCQGGRELSRYGALTPNPRALP